MSEVKKTIKKPSRSGKPLNESEKAEAIALWRAGDTTLDQLEDRFNRSRPTFTRLFNAHNVAKGEARAETAKKVTAAVEAATLSDIETLAQRIKETKEGHYKIATWITGLATGLIRDARENKKSYASIGPDLKALKMASDIFKTMRDEKYALLGLNEREALEDNEVDELVIQEITQEEILEKHRNQPGNDDLDFGVDVDDLDDVEAAQVPDEEAE